MNYFDVLLARKLEDKRDPQIVGLSVTENGTYSEEGKVYKPVVVNVPLPANAYLNKSLSGLPADIATFNDGQVLPLSNLKVGIEAVQSGSGDPSPSNPRPISGWSSVNVTNRSNGNQWDEEWEVGLSTRNTTNHSAFAYSG